jgi:hypothetical protein
MGGLGGIPGGVMPGQGMNSGGGASGLMGGAIGMGGMSGEMMGGGGGMAFSEDSVLEGEIQRLVTHYAQLDDAEQKQSVEQEVANRLQRIFELRQHRRMTELLALEQRVQRLRTTLESREEMKSEIIKNRLESLLREAEGLGWGDEVTRNDGVPGPFGDPGRGR